MNVYHPLDFMAEAFPRYIYIKFYHPAIIRVKYADGFYNSMNDSKYGHIPSTLFMFTCTALRHALLECQHNNGAHPKPSKSKLKADRPDRLNYFNYTNDGGLNACCCAAMGFKLLTSPGVAEMYTFLMTSWKTRLESYQQMLNWKTVASVKCWIQQAENPTPGVVISMEASRVDNAILLAYLTSEVALEEPEIRSTDPTIPIDNNWTDDKLNFGIPGGGGDYDDERDESDKCNTLHTTRQLWRPATVLERFELGTIDIPWCEGENGNNADADEQEKASQANDGSMQNVEDWGNSKIELGTSDVHVYECENGDNADADEEYEVLQADDGSMQNVEEWGHSTREWEDWTVYFRPVQYDNGKADATASDVSKAKTVLQYVTQSQCYTYKGRVRDPIHSNSGEVECGYRPKKGIKIARCVVDSYSITAAPAKSVTHV